MKMRLTTIFGAGLMLAACASEPLPSVTSGPLPSVAGEQPNILMMGEDADADTVPRNSRVFRRVLDALAEELGNKGFKVYDEVAVSLDNFVQGRMRRHDVEIIDVARSIKRPPIDVVTMFSIYANARKTSYTTKVDTRITGRLLNVRSGERLGNFEVKLDPPGNAPVDCDRECILETVGGNAKVLAHDLGAVLAVKLDALSPTSDGASTTGGLTETDPTGLSVAYTLTFAGFTSDEITRVEEYIAAFRGYEHHRPVKTGLRTAEYWYESQSDTARLNRNLRRMLDHLGIQGRVAYAGNDFTVDKITARPKRR